MAENNRGAAATPSPDPALEAAEIYAEKGAVQVSYGGIDYHLHRSRSDRSPFVRWKHSTDPDDGFWRDLNPGWGFASASYRQELTPAGAVVDYRIDAVAAALTVLQPIFSGLPVWQLRCGKTMTPQYYPDLVKP